MGNKSIRIIGLFTVLVLAVLLYVNLTPEQLGKTNIENISSNPVQECFSYDASGMCVALVTSSVIDIDNIVTSDQTIVEQFLDSSSLLESKFGLETVVLLIDPLGNTQKTSDILNLPFQALIDQNSKILDLSNLKASFYFLNKDKSTSVNIQGDVEFYLDDVIINGGKKKIFASGNTLTNKTLQLSVADVSFAPFSERKDGFGFTFIDEIPKWADNTEHSFRIVIRNVQGEILNDGQQPKKIEWTGEHIAYELKLLYDDTRLAVVSNNQVKLDLKADSTISSCAMGARADYGRFMQNGIASNQVLMTYVGQPAKSPQIIIKENGNIVTTVSGSNGGDSGSVIVAPNQIPSSIPAMQIIPPTNKCEKFESLKRDTSYVVTIDGKDYPFRTPKTQQNYFIQCDHHQMIIGDSNPLAHSYFFKGYKYMKCDSNFGYSNEILLIP